MIEVKMGVISAKKRFFVDFTYDASFKEELKLIPGTRFDPKQKYWHMPMDIQNAREVNELVKKRGSNARLVLMPEIVMWLRDEKTRYDNLIKPDDLTADVSQFLPHLRSTRPDIIAAMEQKPWQIPGAAFMAGQRQVILADKPGLGKTLQTIAMLLELDIRGPILVIAPRSAVNVTWPEEIEQWVGENEDITVINSSISAKDRSTAIARVLAASSNSNKRYWVFAGPNYLRISADTDDYGNYIRDNKGNKIIRTVREAIPELFGIKWSAIIVDECHQTLAGAKGDKKKQSAQRQGLGALSLASDAPMIAISGTPFRGKTENIWGTLNWLFPKKYTSSWNFFKRHYGVTEGFSQFGSGIVKGDTVLDEKKFYAELRPVMVRRTKEEIQKCLPPEKRMPPKQYGGTHLDHNDPDSPVAVWLPMSREQQRQYDRVVSDAIIYLDDIVEINVNGALAEMTRFKQLANASLGSPNLGGRVLPLMPSNKIDWCLDFADDRLSSGTKIIIASQFTQFLELMSNEFRAAKFPHYLFTGKTSDKQRAEIKKGFQGDGDSIILLNTISGGASLNLDMADDVVVCDKTWNPDDQEQVEDRAHRPASDKIHWVNIWNLCSLGTIDEDIALVNAEREQQAHAVLDGTRGIKYTKELIKLTKERMNK